VSRSLTPPTAQKEVNRQPIHQCFATGSRRVPHLLVNRRNAMNKLRKRPNSRPIRCLDGCEFFYYRNAKVMESYCYLAARLDCMNRAETSACSLHTAGHLNRKKQFDQLAAGVEVNVASSAFPQRCRFPPLISDGQNVVFEKC